MRFSDLDIERAEQLLLPSGCDFDKERQLFIRKFDSCDLLAVPGSGKTTALQAKLYCIAKQMPLKDGQGVLVLSHTNNAVNEIKSKLLSSAPALFEAPNFIGTVQSFVNTFLTIPFYEKILKKKIVAIDGDLYNKEIEYCLKQDLPSSIWALKKKNFNFEEVRFFLSENKKAILLSDVSGSQLKYPTIKKWKNEGTEEEKIKEIEGFLIKTKCHILKKGILHFDDCYFLAFCYLNKYPYIIKALRRRFKYIFIDETQDLEARQLNLIDNIFNHESCVLQRIGDKNQSIFRHPGIKTEDQWKTRNIITLNNSFRLTAAISKVVDPFTVDKAKDDLDIPKFVVKGKRILDRADIPPHLILFNSKSTTLLLPCYNEIINNYNLRSTIEGQKYGFYIIGWNVKHSGSKRLRLSDIFPRFVNPSMLNKEAYETASEFINYGSISRDIKSCRDVILKIFLHILRLSRVTNSQNAYYTITSLYKHIALTSDEVFDKFKLIVHKLSIYLYKDNTAQCYLLLKQYITEFFKKVFSTDVPDVVNVFFEPEYTKKEFLETDEYPDIAITSAHSVKGQTHCATMYVETSYRSYEYEHLSKVEKKATKTQPAKMYPNPLFQEEARYTQTTSISAMRMMYVGFSRPTHLLCYASFKDSWTTEDINRMIDLGWIVKDLTLEHKD